MIPPPPGTTAALIVGAVLLLGGASGSGAQAMVPGSAGPGTSAAGESDAAFGGARGDGGDGYRSVRTYAGVAAPVRLRIPFLGISSGLERLGLAADGSITPPGRWEEAGWYAGGPRPGQRGPAVIVGHVDSTSGPAVFYHLADLRPGDDVYVDREDGTSERFRVTGRRQVPKDHFPAEVVYAPTLVPSLILMTCGGTFDAATGHYRDNVLVTTEPA